MTRSRQHQAEYHSAEQVIIAKVEIMFGNEPIEVIDGKSIFEILQYCLYVEI